MTDDVERLLQEAGARWRAAQPPPPEPDLSRLTQRRPGWRVPALAAASVALITGGLVGVGVLSTDSDQQEEPASTPPIFDSLAAVTVHEGAAVSATGILLDQGTGSVVLCEPAPEPSIMYPAGQEPPPSCSPLAIELAGLSEEDIAAIPGWTERQGVRFTGLLTVTGTFSDGRLEAEEFQEAEPSGLTVEEERFPLPCDPPEGGWRPATGDEEAQRAALQEEVDAHPELYSGLWVAYPEGDPTSPEVIVVGVAGNAAARQAQLQGIYAGNLCVASVPYSYAELSDVAERLTAAHTDWQTEIQPDTATVVLRLPVFTPADRELIGDDAALLTIEPLVRPIASSSEDLTADPTTTLN